MIKVAMIGAGSVVFSKNLTGDILSFPEFKNATLAYMDVDEERLQVGADLCRKVAKTLNANPTILATTDRREALQGADFVINMVQIGGFNSTLVDFEIPRKYGLQFTIADTTGPGGLFRALRTYPMLTGLCQDMMQVCPKAVLLNYSNPMSMNMQTITRTSDIRAVGLCHSVQGTLNQIMGYIGEDSEQVAFLCGGINHMAFFTKLEKDGQDLYPRLFAAMDDEKTYDTNKVRFEIMRRLGYFVTESSEHNAEYSPYFMTHGADMIGQYDVPLDEYLRRCDGIVDEFDRMKTFSKSDEPMEVHRSHEYGSTIIHSISTGTPSVVYGNMPNNGAISSLPDSAIAEAPTLVDRAGLQFTTFGELPPQLVGYMNPHITQHELFIRAAMEGRRDHLYQAAMFDPLTAAQLTLDQIVEMCDELIEGHRDFLPPLDAKTRVAGSGKTFSPPTPQQLRDSWDAAQKDDRDDVLEHWKVIGPFAQAPQLAASTRSAEPDDALSEKGLISAADDAQRDAAEKNGASGNGVLHAPFVADENGKIDTAKTVQSGARVLAWQSVEAPNGKLGLSQFANGEDGDAVFAYTEYDSIHARETVLKISGDADLKVFLNGETVCEARRGESENTVRQTAVRLQSGVNSILVETAGDAVFSIAIPKANF